MNDLLLMDMSCAPGCGCGEGIIHRDTSIMVMQEGSVDWQEEYFTRILPLFEGVTDMALNNVSLWINSLDRVPPVEEFNLQVERILQSEFEKINPLVAERFVDEMYNFHLASSRLAPGIDISFGGADLRAVNTLAAKDNLVLSKFLRNPGTQSTLRSFIKNEYLEGSGTLFSGDNSEAIRKLRRNLKGKLKDVTNNELTRIIETSVQRIRNRAHLQQLDIIGSTYLEVIEPTRECEFCQFMHKKKIKVSSAVERASFLDGLSEREFLNQFKMQQNKPDVINGNDFISRGLLPPYHPHCHGRVRIHRG